ncbi:Plexin-A4-like [Oopsacas minuta]|uniref:Plexin-A4-like n=1 Tax=Oopsacas minuta TaxID=111878 RepID=A0AAV7KJD6_9METZ|nr:Plexin-A4-like [Oopsacas minuta]
MNICSNMIIFILTLFLTVCYSQTPIRIESISNPNRLGFSLIAIDSTNLSVLIGGSDYIVRVGSEFKSSSITNLPNLASRVSLVEYDHFNNRFFVCDRERVCHFYDTSDITTSVATITDLSTESDNIPNSALFAMLAGSPAVFVYSSFISDTATSTRYTLQGFTLSDLSAATARFTGQPRVADTRRTLINEFVFGDRIFYLVRQLIGTSPISSRLFTICDNTSVGLGRFESVLELILTPCDGSYTYLLSGRIVSLQDGQTHLVLIYSANEMGIETRLCTLCLNDLIQYISVSYNDPSLSTKLDWVERHEAGGNIFAESVLNGISLCDYTFSGLLFALMIPITNGYPTAPLLPSVYSSGVTYGRVSNLYTSQLDTFYYLILVTEEGFMFKYYINGTSLTADVTELEGRYLSENFRDRVSSLVPIGTNHILALTPRELLRIPVSDCGRHDNCMECVQDRDPLCGWCSVQNKCTRQSNCINHNLTNRWIQDDVTECLAVTSVSPDLSNININTTVTISASNLPELSTGNTYQCVFSSLGNTAVTGGFDLTGPASGPVNLTCQIPDNTPSFNKSEFLEVQLYLSTTESSDTILVQSFSFLFFNCSYHTACEECVSTSDVSPCGWCVYSGTCTYSSSLCPPLNLSDSYQWRQSLCPSIESLNSSSNPLVADTDNTINLLTVNDLPTPQSSYKYLCQLSYGSEQYNIPGNHSSNYITCYMPADILTVTSSDIIDVNIDVTFSDRVIYTDTLELYSCVQQGTTCAQCLSNRQSKILCGWCLASGDDSCSTADCSGDFLTASCPNPFITSITPDEISVYFTDQLSIRGTDLGLVSDQLTITVELGEIRGILECVDINRDPSDIGREVNCTLSGLLLSPLGPPGSSGNTTLALSIDNSLGDPLEAYYHPLHILSPQIQAFTPNFGPVAGGTLVTLSGVGLGVGSSRSAEIITVTSCMIVLEPSYSNGELECITQPAMSKDRGQFRVTIDGDNYDSTTGLFEFRENPQIISATPTGVLQSGDGLITFTGISLDASADPRIMFYSGRSVGEYACNAITTSELKCPFPPSNTSKRQTGSDNVNFTLLFDGYTNTLPTIDILVLPDPLFNQGVFVFSDYNHISVDAISRSVELVFIQQADYRLAQLSDLFSVEVTLADEVVNISSNVTYLTNRLSVDFSDIRVDALQSDTYHIYVLLEGYRTPAGRFVIISGIESLKDLGIIVLSWILGLLLLIVILVLILVCIMYCLRRRYSIAHRKAVKKLIYEMDTIEIRIAQACKNEFAELNTELEEASDLTQGSQGAIPFLSFHRYLLNAMFPEETYHTVLYPVRIPHGINEKELMRALELFDELLRDKNYFLSLVNCVESNRSFSLRDRSNIANLFALCMHDDIQYLTSVLKKLLEELFETMVAKSRVNNMFHRTHTVAEKLLSNWLAMMMYRFLIDGPGPAIHLAYRATKRQTEKGPIDVVTGEAKYSLDKEKLLTQISDEEIKELEVGVITDNETDLKVKLLECDTISQAKLKIMDVVYSEVPVSQRPHITKLDLEVHTTRKQSFGLILRDNDWTSIVQGDWKRVNTLSHYSAVNQPVFKLVPRTQIPQGGQICDYLGTLIQYRYNSVWDTHIHEEDKTWHLTDPQEIQTVKPKKLATEIYLIRLISTKNILQKYLDDMVYAIFPDVMFEPHKLAQPIKYIFDFLDYLVEKYNIDNKDNVLRMWKNKCVPIGFWANLIRNPNHLFDVIKSETLDTNLSVISQVLIDSCLGTDSHITEDDPTTKILYYREVPIYREHILKYHDTMSQSPAVSDEQLFESYRVPKGGDHFYKESALLSLYSYADSCKDKIVEEMLYDGGFDKQIAKIEEISELLTGQSNK